MSNDRSSRTMIAAFLIVAALIIATNYTVEGRPIRDWWLPGVLLLAGVVLALPARPTAQSDDKAAAKRASAAAVQMPNPGTTMYPNVTAGTRTRNYVVTGGESGTASSAAAAPSAPVADSPGVTVPLNAEFIAPTTAAPRTVPTADILRERTMSDEITNDILEQNAAPQSMSSLASTGVAVPEPSEMDMDTDTELGTVNAIIADEVRDGVYLPPADLATVEADVLQTTTIVEEAPPIEAVEAQASATDFALNTVTSGNLGETVTPQATEMASAADVNTTPPDVPGVSRDVTSRQTNSVEAVEARLESMPSPDLESDIAANQPDSVLDPAAESDTSGADTSGVRSTDSDSVSGVGGIVNEIGETNAVDVVYDRDLIASDAAPETVSSSTLPVIDTGVKPFSAQDLEIIDGIGPKIAAVLIAAGIRSFDQLSSMSEADLKQIVNEGGIRLTSSLSSWAAQSAYAARGDWEGMAHFNAVRKGQEE